MKQKQFKKHKSCLTFSLQPTSHSLMLLDTPSVLCVAAQIHQYFLAVGDTYHPFLRNLLSSRVDCNFSPNFGDHLPIRPFDEWNILRKYLVTIYNNLHNWFLAFSQSECCSRIMCDIFCATFHCIAVAWTEPGPGWPR